MNDMLNVSSSPHIRSKLSTGIVMYDVILALVPAAFAGIYHFGLDALLVILASIFAACLSEFIFDYITGRANTLKDGSAVLTGLLLALCLPSTVPLFIPVLGAVFAIIVVKCLFGGLGKNFMNPALAARCFLLISFGTLMTSYTLDGVTSATPIQYVNAGSQSLSIMKISFGLSAGVIGCSSFALLAGGLYLLAVDGITWEIPVSTIVSFVAFLAVFGGENHLDPRFLLGHLFSGGIIMAAFFMAADPVTSPVTSAGQLIFGASVGILSGVFRVFGNSADSVSYAVIISNLFTPMLDKFIVPKPYAFRKQTNSSGKFLTSKNLKTAFALFIITVLAGIGLSSVYKTTEPVIKEQELAAQLASYKDVLPEAETFEVSEEGQAAIDALNGGVYGSGFGRVYINGAYVGKDDSGTVQGYVISVTTADGFDGNITLSAGIRTDGTLSRIAFTELAETAGMGMKADEPEFKEQFTEVNVEQFTLNKAGGSTADDEIDSVSGASITSGAVVNAVNAALDFFAANFK